MLIPAVGLAWALGGGLLALMVLALWLTGLVDLSKRSDLERGTRLAWILLIVLLPLVGTLIYFAMRPTLPEERDKIIRDQTRLH